MAHDVRVVLSAAEKRVSLELALGAECRLLLLGGTHTRLTDLCLGHWC